MPKTITALQIQKHNKERVNVFLDDEYAFAVTLMVAAGLKKGQQLSVTEIEELRREDERNQAYDRAVRYLGYRPRSQTEVERYLSDKGYGADVIASVIERLQHMNYLDDEAFARYWVENRERFRPRGARALRYELHQKGIADAIAETVLADLDEEGSAWTAVEPKLHGWRRLDQESFKRKIMGYLSRRGFSYEIVRAVYRRAWAASHDAEPDDDLDNDIFS